MQYRDDSTAAAGEITGAHLAHLLGKPATSWLTELVGRDLADNVIGWYRSTIGRCAPDPMAEDVLVIPLAGEVGTLVTEFLADHGVTPPTRLECREWSLADRDAGGDGVDPLAELARATYGVDPDLPTAAAEPRIHGVPKSVFDLLTEDEQAKVKAGLVVPTPRAPLPVARWLTRHRYTVRMLLPGQRRHAWMRTVLRIDQTWFHYARPAGQPHRWIARTDPEWMPGQLRDVLGELWYVKTGKQGGLPVAELKWWNPDSTSVTEVERALMGLLADKDDDDTIESGTAARELPDAYGHRHDAYGNANVLCRNGVLDPTCGILLPNTPLWFSPPVIAAAYQHGLDLGADTEWMSKVLRTQWADDPGAIICLQQWFGYVLSGRTDLQKFMLILGPSGSSKSIITDVLGSLMGIVTATKLDTLNGRFGLQSLYESGAQLAPIPDIRFSSRDSTTAVGNLLAVIGEDTVNIERKNKIDVSAKLGVRFHGSANEMPRWNDNSSALRRRALILETTKGFRGTDAEDPRLKQRILDSELGYVLRWAVEGLALLNAAGGTFTQSAQAAELAAEMDDGNSVARMFLEECCVIGSADDFVLLRELFQVFKNWSEATNSGKGMTQNGLMRAIRGMHHEVVKIGQAKGETVKRVRGIKQAQVPGRSYSGLGLGIPPHSPFGTGGGVMN